MSEKVKLKKGGRPQNSRKPLDVPLRKIKCKAAILKELTLEQQYEKEQSDPDWWRESNWKQLAAEARCRQPQKNHRARESLTDKHDREETTLPVRSGRVERRSTRRTPNTPRLRQGKNIQTSQFAQDAPVRQANDGRAGVSANFPIAIDEHDEAAERGARIINTLQSRARPPYYCGPTQHRRSGGYTPSFDGAHQTSTPLTMTRENSIMMFSPTSVEDGNLRSNPTPFPSQAYRPSSFPNRIDFTQPDPRLYSLHVNHAVPMERASSFPRSHAYQPHTGHQGRTMRDMENTVQSARPLEYYPPPNERQQSDHNAHYPFFLHDTAGVPVGYVDSKPVSQLDIGETRSISTQTAAGAGNLDLMPLFEGPQSEDIVEGDWVLFNSFIDSNDFFRNDQ